jgi:hypothetical protein
VDFGGGRGGGGGFGGGGAGAGAVTPENAPLHPVGQNPPSGVMVQYWLGTANQEVTLDFLDAAGNVIRSFTSRQDSATAAESVTRAASLRSRMDSLRARGLSDDSIRVLTRVATDAAGGIVPADDAGPPRAPPPARASNRRGLNTFAWNMRYPDASSFPGMILWAAGTTGPLVPPATYRVRLSVAGRPVGAETFRILPDPRRKATVAEWTEQSRLALQVRDRFSQANDAVKTIRFVKGELTDREKKVPAPQQSAFRGLANPFATDLSVVEDSLYQTRNRSGQDPLNYPIRLNNKIGALMGVVAGADGRPTQQSYEVYKVLSTQLDRELARLRDVMAANLPKVNAFLQSAGAPQIRVPPGPGVIVP